MIEAFTKKGEKKEQGAEDATRVEAQVLGIEARMKALHATNKINFRPGHSRLGLGQPVASTRGVKNNIGGGVAWCVIVCYPPLLLTS